MSKNESLLSMMPPEAQKQVLLLIKRLGDEKQAKQQAQRQCAQYEAQICQLKKELQNLKKENVGLKAKWQNKVQMISKVRENFSGSKRGNGDESGRKKLRFNKDQGDWQESEEEDESTQDQLRINNRNKQAISKIEQTKSKNNSQTKQSTILNTHFSIQSQTLSTPISTNIQTIPSGQHAYNQSLSHSTTKKPPRPNQNNSLSKLNITTKSNKKLQIECLKQEIEQLTQEIRTKETGGMSLDDKIRRCEEIKNRYKKGGSTECQQPFSLKQQKQINSSAVMTGYYSPRKQPQNHSQNYGQQSFIHELSSNHKASSNHQPSSNHKPQKHSINAHQKLYHSPNINSNNISFIHTINPNQSHLFKQNIQDNNSSSFTQFQLHNNILNNQSPMIIPNGTHPAKPNFKQFNTNNCSNKTKAKPIQQSFYDDELLDLIAQINP